MGTKSKKKRESPKVNPDLEGFDIKIDTFGEIKSNYNIEKINKFLDKNVEDKKLVNRNEDPQVV